MASLPTLSRRSGGALEPGAAGERGARLGRRLVAAGPLAAGFGIYLGSRVDLLAGADCLRLLEIADRSPPSPPARVAALVERQLGARPKELFELFEPEPLHAGLLLQRHRARLPGGEEVTVELLRPELASAAALDGLRAVAERAIGAGELPPSARAAVDEFAARLDLRRAAEALAELGDETDGWRRVEVPDVHRDLCSRGVRVISTLRDDDAEEAAGEKWARRLGRVWFAMALDGDLFPVEPWGANVAYAESGRVAFLGGELHRLPRRARADLREYLAAVAAREPARAALAFLELLPDSPTDRRLRDRLRHTDPFRDRGWDVGGDLFARQVLAHWRTAAELGHTLPPALVPFYRGLFLLNQEVRRLAGDEAAAVRDGLREARLLLLAGELRIDGDGERWTGVFERQLSLLSGLPWKLDRILTLAAAEDRRDDGEDRRRDGRERRRGGSGAAVAALLLALTAVVLLTHHVADAALLGAAAEPLGALLVLLLGGLALGVAGSSGDG